jgi:glycosyltransferase involved in cell wall biosynthesis
MTSVITPAFNVARTLNRAHQSLHLQDGDWEHIIVDDGSTDSTARVIDKLLEDPRVTRLSQPNGGPGSALNLGIRSARGRYIAFLDADDEYLPEHVSAHIRAMDRDPSLDVLWGGMEVVSGRVEDLLVPDAEKGSGLISVMDCVVQGTLFVRRKVFETCMFSEDRAIWWQDYEFVQRASREYHVRRFHQATYRYYRDSGKSLVDRAKAAAAMPWLERNDF